MRLACAEATLERKLDGRRRAVLVDRACSHSLGGGRFDAVQGRGRLAALASAARCSVLAGRLLLSIARHPWACGCHAAAR